MPLTITRRNFLRASSTLAAGAAFPAIARAATGAAAPSNRVNVAAIGLRNMGWNDLQGVLKNPSARCVGLCDIDKSTLDQRTGQLSKRAPLPGDFLATDDYRRLLDRKDIDAVLIGTPDHWHCLPFVDACKAGKDVYVQKPLANSIAECDAMVAATRKYNRVVQVGQQQRGGGYWRELIKFLHSGSLGRISHVHVWANFGYASLPPLTPGATPPAGVDYDRWLGPSPVHPFDPQRFHGSWRCFWDHGGGLLTDWGVHLLDIALWGMKVTDTPLRTLATGGKFASPQGGHETFDTLSVLWQHKDFLMTWENSTALERGPYNKNYGLSFTGEKGIAVANRSGWEFYPGRDTKPAEISKGDGWGNANSLLNHTRNFVECVKTRNTQTDCPVEAGALAAKYAHLGNISARLGGVGLAYDSGARKFDVAAADKYIRPEYRAPWKFPEE
jgi:predicted dehydrogenase